MIRGILFFIAILFLYHAVRTIIRSAFSAYHAEETRRPPALKGEEMILDPECRTYVIKQRAVTRRVGRTVHSFCSEACADRFEKAHYGERG